MTREELMQSYYIDRELKSWRQELECGDISKFNKRRIGEKISELEKMRKDIMDYILSIKDSQTRLIFKLRCMNLLEWNDIADSVGGGNTEYTVKKRFYRYIERHTA